MSTRTFSILGAVGVAIGLSSAAPPLLAGGVETGRILWSGALDALERQPAPDSFVLSPDGRGLFYFQGAPWPRLLFRSLDEPGSEARMVAPFVPFRRRPPRVAPSGEAVYFTAIGGTESRPDAAPGSLPLHVVRASLPSFEILRIHPAREAPEDAFSVLLDVHPSGETILIGTGRGYTGRGYTGSVSEAPGVRVDLVEIAARGGPASPLGIEVDARAFVRYSRDGARVLFTVAPRDDPEAEVWIHDRGSGGRRRTAELLADRPRRAGDVDVRSFLVPHRGSFGWDGFRTHELRERGSSRHTTLRFSPEIAALSPLAAVPLEFRGGRVLLRTGPTDRPRLVLAEMPWDREDLSTASPEDPRTALALHPEFLSGKILARHDPSAAKLLEALRAHLRSARARSPGALGARFLQSSLAATDAAASPVEVLEHVSGRLRIEHVLELAAGPDVPVDPEDAGPRRRRAPRRLTRVLAFDGRSRWTKDTTRAVRALDIESFTRQHNAFSLFRLLLDPAGLADDRARFGAPIRRPGPGPAASWTLSLRYDDGFEATLTIRESAGEVLPLSIDSPLLLATLRETEELGALPATRTVSFHDWRLVEGWRVPHEIHFAGVRPYRLRIETLEFLDGAELERFRRPAAE
ncbi:MAG: hypothetical protein O7J95_00045 [Planctomycetota bacterium]|nr:hypothetical protein [Planctomycetota bacterium]